MSRGAIDSRQALFDDLPKDNETLDSMTRILVQSVGQFMISHGAGPEYNALADERMGCLRANQAFRAAEREALDPSMPKPTKKRRRDGCADESTYLQTYAALHRVLDSMIRISYATFDENAITDPLKAFPKDDELFGKIYAAICADHMLRPVDPTKLLTEFATPLFTRRSVKPHPRLFAAPAPAPAPAVTGAPAGVGPVSIEADNLEAGGAAAPRRT
ncbi:MAG: hypothetical protein P1U40_12270 [Coxiellaceae bacterium]|nr:hypothetical protein [Coxiellaceae bacterium]